MLEAALLQFLSFVQTRCCARLRLLTQDDNAIALFLQNLTISAMILHRNDHNYWTDCTRGCKKEWETVLDSRNVFISLMRGRRGCAFSSVEGGVQELLTLATTAPLLCQLLEPLPQVWLIHSLWENRDSGAATLLDNVDARGSIYFRRNLTESMLSAVILDPL